MKTKPQRWLNSSRRHFVCVILPVALLLIGNQFGSAQGFQNLDFESANISGYSPGSQNVPVSAALPGWAASFVTGTSTNVATQVWYDGISFGGAGISVIDTNAPIFSPLQGKYSAFLFGGAYGNTALASAGISQSGLVPTGTESLLIDAYVSGASFIVTLGGQTINMTLLQGFSN
jgi:hypothetical protein